VFLGASRALRSEYSTLYPFTIMKKSLLSVGRLGALLLGLWLSPTAPVAAQSAWVYPPTAPVYTFGSLELASPQPNVLWGVFMRAAMQQTSYGYVFRSLDNGLTWQQQEVVRNTSTSYLGELRSVFALDADRAWILQEGRTGVVSLSRTTAGPSNFQALVTPADFERVYFFNATVGVGIGKATGGGARGIYRTTDGGTSWTLLASAPPLANSSGAFVRSYALVGNSLWVATSENNILRTTDGGLTWSSTPSGITLLSVAFRDAENGVATGYTGGQNGNPVTSHLLRTTDGGLIWAPVAVQGTWRTSLIAAVPGSAGVYVSAGYSYSNNSVNTNFSVSTDDGATWQSRAANENVRYKQLLPNASGEVWASNSWDYNPNTAPAYQGLIMRYNGPALVTATVAAPKTAVLAAYPNPTTGLVYIPELGTANDEVRVYNSRGQLVQLTHLAAGPRTIDLSAAAPGLYQVVLTAATGRKYTQCVVKTN
jgi:photosystem II stability/assembly factor-like uncharacterized protein